VAEEVDDAQAAGGGLPGGQAVGWLGRHRRGRATQGGGVTAPGWVRHAVWYHLYPLGFLGAPKLNTQAGSADGGVEHRLRKLDVWLDYFIELGANGLLLGPIFESETHGYDIVDYYRIDRRLGDQEDLDWLVQECQRRGLRIVLDGVFNHVGRGFPPFADVRARRRESTWASWFRFDVDDTSPDGLRYATFEGHEGLVALNHDEAEVLDLAVDVTCHWLARGVDGFRLDAGYAVPVRFWRAFTDRVRTSFPDAWLVAEVIHGDYGRFAADTGIHSVTQYELWKAIWSALNDHNLFELAHALGRHDGFSGELLAQTFVGNHDVTRLASQLHDIRHLPHALVVLFTVAGTPSVYAGDEQAFVGRKYHRAGGDDDIRPAFPSSPAELPADGWETYRLHQQLIALRRRHPALSTARTQLLHLSNEQIVYRSVADDDIIIVALNCAEVAAAVPIDTTELSLEAGTVETPGQALTVGPHCWRIFNRTASIWKKSHAISPPRLGLAARNSAQLALDLPGDAPCRVASGSPWRLRRRL
jgi:cyclomaltodextrinase